MKQLAFYHKDTGLLSPYHLITSDDGNIALNTPPGHLPIEHPEDSPLDHRRHRVDPATKSVLPYAPPPDPAEERRVARRARQSRMRVLLDEQRKAIVAYLTGGESADKIREIESELTSLTAGK